VPLLNLLNFFFRSSLSPFFVGGPSHPEFLAEGYMAVARGSFPIKTGYEGCGLETLPPFSVVR